MRARLRRWATAALRPLDRRLVAAVDADAVFAAAPPLFVVGPPRSGSTLLVQVLLNVWRWTVFTNFAAKLAESPVAATWLQRRWPGGGGTVPFASDYGRTAGWRGPSEAGGFWYRWFPRGRHVYAGADALGAGQRAELRATLAAMTAVGGAPLLVKNLFNSMRLQPLAAAVPEARFLVVRRDLVDNAASILRARDTAGGGRAGWWSVPPRQIDELSALPVHEQVVAQVVEVLRQIDADQRAIGAERFHWLDYERLCAEPAATIAAVDQYLSRTGGAPARRHGDLPPHFRSHPSSALSPADQQALARAATTWAERLP